MDFITKFDIEVDEEFYFVGDTVKGNVALNLIQNIKATSVKVSSSSLSPLSLLGSSFVLLSCLSVSLALCLSDCLSFCFSVCLFLPLSLTPFHPRDFGSSLVRKYGKKINFSGMVC